MDANGTRYHLLLGRDNWGTCALASGLTLRDVWAAQRPDPDPNREKELDSANLAWNKERSELTLEPLLFQYIAAPRDESPAIEDRRGADRDQFENWYWIDDSRSAILARSSGSQQTTRFWSAEEALTCVPQPRYGDFEPKFSAPPPAPLSLQGLCVTDQHYLVVGQLNPPGLLIFDLYAGGAPREMLWPPGIDFEPWDMSANEERIFILDRAHRRYWILDCYFNVIRAQQAETTILPSGVEDFQPQGRPDDPLMREGYTFPQGITLADASPVDVADPVSIAALPDSTVLILDHVPVEKFSRIYRYKYSQRVAVLFTKDISHTLEEKHAANFHLTGYDLAFVSHEITREDGVKVLGQVFVTEANGNQTFAFDLLENALELLADYYPMRLFGGKALVETGGSVYYDFEDRWIPLIKQNRPRYARNRQRHPHH